jgi:tetratricopeptide (TPR) repeat protein
MATFSGASDAVAAAVAIQQAIDRLNRSGKAPVPLAVRVGLSAGDVTFEADDTHGTPVIEAARLCAAAAGGEILVSEVVRLLAGAAESWALAVRGPLVLKGLAAPLSTWEVRWEPAPVSTIPMPALLTDVGQVFVGRDGELERLQRLWKEAAAGERRVALIGGEPGIGKTRLAAELAIRVHDDGGVVLAGRCDEDLDVPYQPFVEALRHFVDHTAPADLKERLGRHGGELVRLLPELSERSGRLPDPLRSDPETERYRLFDGVAGWLSELSAEEPLLLVLDDLQWAAKPTLLLLRHVVRSADVQRLLILVTYRDSELRPDGFFAELLADLGRHHSIDRLPIVGFDVSAVGAYFEAAIGRRLDEGGFDLARIVQRETEGNPFFVREVLRHLVETGLINRDGEGRWTTHRSVEDVGIPQSVRDVVGRRLSRLSEATNRALRVAAVTGADFELSVVQAAAGMDEETLLSAVEEATGARLVVEERPNRFRFSHALVRDTIYSGLACSRQVALHRRVGEAIENVHAIGVDDHLQALALHWTRATMPESDSTKAVDYSARAGDQAMAQLAFEAAGAYYQEALTIMESAAGTDSTRRGQLLLGLGRARARSGDTRAADAYHGAVAQARSTGDAELLAAAALGMSDLWSFSSAVGDTRITLLEEAQEALGATIGASTAYVLARLATELYTVPGSWDRRQRLSAESVDVARRLGDPLTLAFSLHARNYTLWAPGGAEERLAQGREIIDLAHQGGDPELALQGHAWCQIALLELGDVTRLDVQLTAYEQLADDLRQPRYRWYATSRRAMRTLLAGDLDGGEALVRKARQLGREAGEPDAENVFSTQMFAVWEDRPSPEGLTVFDAVCEAAAGTLQGESPLVLGLGVMRLLLMLDTPAAPDARRELADLIEPAIDQLDPTYYGMGWSILSILLSTAATRLCVPEASAVLYELLLPFAGLVVHNCGAVAFHGSYSHHLGTLATTLRRWSEAEDHFADASAKQEAMGARAYLARTRLEWARMLLTRRPGDPERAKKLLGQALATARQLGLAKVERDVVGLLQ